MRCDWSSIVFSSDLCNKWTQDFALEEVAAKKKRKTIFRDAQKETTFFRVAQKEKNIFFSNQSLSVQPPQTILRK